MRRLAALCLVTLAMVGCAHDPVSVSKTNNPQMAVGLLFEVDGVKVYRFYDSGHYHYFANASGVIREAHSEARTQSAGKTTTTTHHTVYTEVPTVE